MHHDTVPEKRLQLEIYVQNLAPSFLWIIAQIRQAFTWELIAMLVKFSFC